VSGPNFTSLGEDIWLRKKFVSQFGYLAAYSNGDGSNLSDVKTTPNFALIEYTREN